MRFHVKLAKDCSFSPQIPLDNIQLFIRKAQSRGDVPIPTPVSLPHAVGESGPVYRPQARHVPEAGRGRVLDAQAGHGELGKLLAGGLYADAREHVVEDDVVRGGAGQALEEAGHDAGAVATGCFVS